MSLRRFAPLALASAVLGCQADIPNQAPPSTLVYAISFPSCSDATQALSAPSPNDLALRAVTTPPTPPQCAGQATPSPAQILALQSFALAGGFPRAAGATTPLPITIQFVEVQTSADPQCGPNFLPAPPTPAAIPFPDLDPASVTATTLALVRYDTTSAQQVPFAVAGYDRTTGVLTIVNATGGVPGAPWDAGGRYVVALRGGANGVKTKTGQPIAAQNATFLLAQDKDLTQFENQAILRACVTNPNDPVQAGVVQATVNQLVTLQSLYRGQPIATDTTNPLHPIFWTRVPPAPAAGPVVWTPVPSGTNGTPLLPRSPFAAVDIVFPHAEIATIQTFVIAPTP